LGYANSPDEAVNNNDLDNSEFKDFFNQKKSPLDYADKTASYSQKGAPIIINATQTITSNHNTYINNVPTQVKYDNRDSNHSNKEITETRNETVPENLIIKSPRLELITTNSKNEKEQQLIVVTPNSINGVVKKTGEKFLFGRNDPRMKNDFNFFDDSVGMRQFELYYDKCKI
jgi:hypothetical protein